MTIELPGGVDWLIYKVAFHRRNRASLLEIETLWSFDDLDLADQVLQAIDVAEIKAAQRGA
jgi:hypothetical protein